jgi:hypothetical protein
VQVRWAWLGFLAAEIVFTALFLAYTILATNKMGIRVLKSSPLATLFALDDECRKAAVAANVAVEARLDGDMLVLANKPAVVDG